MHVLDITMYYAAEGGGISSYLNAKANWLARMHRLGQLGVGGAVHQPLGVDTAIFHPGRRDAGLRARLGLPARTRLLVYAGRFTPQKKLGLLIEAARRLGQR